MKILERCAKSLRQLDLTLPIGFQISDYAGTTNEAKMGDEDQLAYAEAISKKRLPRRFTTWED